MRRSGYLDYDATLDRQGYATSNAAFLRQARDAVLAGRISTTGEAIRTMLREQASL